ncbi:MAG: S8 family serine peptidase [Eubacterium sp.]|nr:S8 family serine peptidase [Eubacterium sp.]
MFKPSKFLTVLLSLSVLTLSLPQMVRAETQISPTDYADQYDLTEGTYKEGSVIVTLASKDATALTKEGACSFDEKITVRRAYDFGSADHLAKSSGDRDFFQDKTYRVSEVTSSHYSTKDLINELSDNAYVLSVEPDYYQYFMGSSDDELTSSQWALDGGDKYQGTSSGINWSKAKEATYSNTPIVAVVDSGVDYTHEDLADNMWVNPYSSLAGTYGYDFGDSDSNPMDSNGHGTHCAGSIAATANNQTGIAGVCQNAKIMALKICDSSGNVSNSYIVSAFNYIYEAQELGANIVAVNCSWGGGSSGQSMINLVDQIGSKGALFVFAAGNDGAYHSSSGVNECPYDFDSDYKVIVGASDVNDQRAYYSDYGKDMVDFFAPGDNILSTVCTDTFFPAIYPQTKQEEMATYVGDGSSQDLDLVYPSQIGISDSNTSYSISQSSDDFFGGSTGSKLVNFSTSSKSSSRGPGSSSGSNSISLYLDVTDLDLDTTASYYVCFDYGVEDSGGICWDHTSLSRTSSSFVSYYGKTYLNLVNLKNSSFSKINFDNISVSKANPSSSSFGKYSTMSGTSMAAPIGTGAVAFLANKYPSDTAKQRHERLNQCIRSVSNLSNACIKGGVLDLSKADSTSVSADTTGSSSINNGTTSSSSSATSKIKVTKVKLNKKKATLRYGKKLKLKATVTPKNATNKKVKWKVNKKKYAKVTKKGVVKAKKKGIGKTVKVYAIAKDGSKKKAVCKVKIKKKKK